MPSHNKSVLVQTSKAFFSRPLSQISILSCIFESRQRWRPGKSYTPREDSYNHTYYSYFLQHTIQSMKISASIYEHSYQTEIIKGFFSRAELSKLRSDLQLTNLAESKKDNPRHTLKDVWVGVQRLPRSMVELTPNRYERTTASMGCARRQTYVTRRTDTCCLILPPIYNPTEAKSP